MLEMHKTNLDFDFKSLKSILISAVLHSTSLAELTVQYGVGGSNGLTTIEFAVGLFWTPPITIRVANRLL